MKFDKIQKMQQIPPFLPTGGHIYRCRTCGTEHDVHMEPAKCKQCIKDVAHLRQAHERHLYNARKNYYHHVETRFNVWAESPWQNPSELNQVFIRWRKKHNQQLANRNQKATELPFKIWLSKQTPPPRPIDPPMEWLESTSGLSLEQWRNTPDNLAHHLKRDFELEDLDINFKQWLTHRHN